MAGLQRVKNVEYFNNEQERTKFVFETIDKLLPIIPEYDSFAIYELNKHLETDVQKRRKYDSITNHIESLLLEKKLIEKVPRHLHFKLTEIGRVAKKKKSLKRYDKSLKPRWTSHQIFTSVISGISIIIAASVAIINYMDKEKSSKQKEQLQSQIDSLNGRIKKLENKTAP